MEAAVPPEPEPQVETAAKLLNEVIPGHPIDRVTRFPRTVLELFRNPINSLPSNLRPAGRGLLLATSDSERIRLIETLGDSSLEAVGDLFLRMLERKTSASVRLALLEYLIRYPRPGLAPMFERLARSDPNPQVAMMALEGLRAIRVQKLREQFLARRLRRSRTGSDAWKAFAEADQRWISLVRGAMLPAFMQVPPPVFSAKEQDRIKVVAFGDFGTGTSEQQQVASAIMTYHQQSPFDIGITVGDNFYPIGIESLKDPRWQTWWEDMYGPLKIVFYPVLGNHDWYDFDSPAAQILYSDHSSSWKMPAPYYTFVAGPVQFFALDTQEISQIQLKWFEEELGKSQATWKVVYAHHPIFSDGYHGDNEVLKEQLMPLMRNRVDLYLTGHEHDMQHLRPVDGVNFVISGGGGRTLRPPRPTSRALFAREAFGFTILEANATQLDIRMVGADAQVMHQFTLRKAGTSQASNVNPRP
jgi:hypothetical protein